MQSSTVLNVIIDERLTQKTGGPSYESGDPLQWAALNHVRTSNSSRVLKDYIFSSEAIVL